MYVHVSKQTPTLVLSSTRAMIPAISLKVEPMMFPAPAYPCANKPKMNEPSEKGVR
jgi:hypothetical protein